MTIAAAATNDTATATTDLVPTSWFDAPICRNCDAPLTTDYCGDCGQKAAKRLIWRDSCREWWHRVRVFEIRSAKTVGRLLLRPGVVARDYVLGRRKANMNPLTLLVALVAVLVLILTANHYFELNGYSDQNNDLKQMAERVFDYAKWSFSLGIFAVFAGSWTVFGRKCDYNAIEHAVLAIYCQNLILAASIVNLLPTLIWREPTFVLAHKIASEYYLPVIKIVIVGAAYKQFFQLKLLPDWQRLALACVVYAVIAWVLLRVYAVVILWLIS